jgi:hypothetical protein
MDAYQNINSFIIPPGHTSHSTARGPKIVVHIIVLVARSDEPQKTQHLAQ